MTEVRLPLRSASSRIRLSALVGALCASALVSCGKGSPPPLEFESGDRAEVTVEGLHRVRGGLVREAWVKPDADFAAYDAVMLDPVEVSYKRKPRSTRQDLTGSNFALDDSQMETFRRYFREAFEKELSASEHYELVSEAGPSVLRVAPAILDLVVKVPTESRGSDRVYTTSTAEMTLLLELRDSLSGEILARVADRREARAAGAGGINDLYYSNSVTDSQAVRRLFARWSNILRTRLDHVHELEPTQSPEEGT